MIVLYVRRKIARLLRALSLLSLLLFPWRGFSGPRPSLPFFPFFFSFCPFLSSYFLQNVLKSKISVNLYSFVWKRANALPSASRPVAKFLSFPSFSRKSLEIFWLFRVGFCGPLPLPSAALLRVWLWTWGRAHPWGLALGMFVFRAYCYPFSAFSCSFRKCSGYSIVLEG